jgi:hypothetical protein
VLKVMQVHQGGFAEVVQGQVEVTGLGRDDRLGAGRQRRVSHGQPLVVLEVPRLLLAGERIAEQVHGQHQVGLLDDLLAVQVEVGEMQHQRVLPGRGAGEIPDLVPGEPSAWECTPRGLVERDGHGLGRIAPASGLLVADAELAGALGIPLSRIRGGQQVPARHQVRVDVVIGQGAVLIRAGDAVDVEPARRASTPARKSSSRSCERSLPSRTSNGSSFTYSRISLPLVMLMISCPVSGRP